MTDKRILLLFFTFILLNGLDVVTTVIGLGIGASEANPTALSLMNSLGLAEAMMVKFFLILFLGCVSLATYWYATCRDRKYVRFTRTFLTVIFSAEIGVYLCVVASNLCIIWLQLNFYS